MFRRTASSRSSSAAAHRRRSGGPQVSWSAAEAAEMIAAPGMAVSAPAGATVTTADRNAEDRAVAVRLDRAWRRLEAAREATEGRPGGIGDDTARRDPVTRPFPIAFGTPARGARSAAPAPVPGVPAVAAAPRPVRRPQAAMAMHRPGGIGQVPRGRAPRRLTADRWSAALG